MPSNVRGTRSSSVTVLVIGSVVAEAAQRPQHLGQADRPGAHRDAQKGDETEEHAQHDEPGPEGGGSPYRVC